MSETDQREAAFRAWIEHFSGQPPYVGWTEYSAEQRHRITEALRVAHCAGFDAGVAFARSGAVKGGLARANSLSAEQRREIAQRAGKARQAKAREGAAFRAGWKARGEEG